MDIYNILVYSVIWNTGYKWKFGDNTGIKSKPISTIIGHSQPDRLIFKIFSIESKIVF